MQTKKEIRESTLAQVEYTLTPTNIKKIVEQYREKFDPKLRAYCILQHKVEDFVQDSLKIWKIVFGLLIDKDDGKVVSTS